MLFGGNFSCHFECRAKLEMGSNGWDCGAESGVYWIVVCEGSFQEAMVFVGYL